ncbi:MAG TPA: alkaline phosphatase family protein [Acidimicrobiales bacterium]|nr:alkaline phosphatase family protein [Acidimicrobiales bacterium]
MSRRFGVAAAVVAMAVAVVAAGCSGTGSTTSSSAGGSTTTSGGGGTTTTGGTTTGGSTTTTTSGPSLCMLNGNPCFSHVFVVLLENLGYTSALTTPGFAELAHRYASATQYYGVSHPSLPNYIALTSGSTQGVTSVCTDCYVNAPNLGSQLSGAGISWGAYMEGIPSSCYLPYSSTSSDLYAGKHDPFRYFDDIRSSASLCSHIVPYPRLAPLLQGSASSVPKFVWVTPNLCNDGHNCGPAVAAPWLDAFVTEVTASSAWKDGGVLFVVWDESDDGDTSGVSPVGTVTSTGGGGHIAFFVIAPGIKPGTTESTPYNHYSLLATIEESFGLPLLGAAKTAHPLSAFFPGGVH